MRPAIPWLLVAVLSASALSAPAAEGDKGKGLSDSDPRLRQALQRALQRQPAADADKDGTLTLDEARAYLKGQGVADPDARIQDLLRRASAGPRPGKRPAGKARGGAYAPAPVDPSKTFGPAAGKKIKLFILSGQSNMVGQGTSAELPDELRRGNDRVLMFERGRWQPLRPLIPRFGPEIAFGQAMAKAWPGETIGIVKQAVGGTGILAWHPNWTRAAADRTGDGRKGNLWKALTDKVRAARAAAPCEPMGFVWMQGGKDMKKVDVAKEYLTNLKALVAGLRKETGAADLPLVLGSYRRRGIPDDLTGFEPADPRLSAYVAARYVLQAQYDAQKALAPAKMVRLQDLETVAPGNPHFNTKGQLALGRLFAEGYLELHKKRAGKASTGVPE